MALGLTYAVSAQLGSVAAAYALEHLGGQAHAYTWREFRLRYQNISTAAERSLTRVRSR